MPLRGSALVIVLLALGGAAGCAHRQGQPPPHRLRPGYAEARAYHYADNTGLSVTTVGAVVEQPVAPNVTLSARLLGDRIVLERKPLDLSGTGSNQPTGHPVHDPDAVSSASAFVAGGAVATKWRVEALAQVIVDGTIGDRPASLRALVRVAEEPDYRAFFTGLRGSVELFQRNLTLTGFFGYGYDQVFPVETPPGQSEQWPASHMRFVFGATVSQLLTSRLVFSAGVASNFQEGRLTSPYRRALVRTSLFPEVLPEQRKRFTAFAALSAYLGAGTALHYRQGAYVDTWSVVGLISDASLVKELGPRGLLALSYRFYKQWPASFYKAVYQDLEPLLAGDPRLGPITEHYPGVQARYTVLGERGGFGSLGLFAGYELSLLSYELLATDLIVGHVISGGIQGTY